MTKVRVTEIFHSIQGESSHSGKPCVFVRLTGCGLRCKWCDTPYAFGGGQEMRVDHVLAAASEYPSRLVEITGGEPMEQEGVYPLIEAFLSERYTVMLETGGHIPLDRIPTEVIKIIDVKCPDSGECGSFVDENIELVAAHDEFKFVIASRSDYEWAMNFISDRLLGRHNTVLFSPAHGMMSPRTLSEWVLSDGLNVRLQLQTHKIIWGSDVRGV